MAITPTSPLIYQAAWTTSELEDMFQQLERRYQSVGGNVMANAAVRETFAKLEQGEEEDDVDDGVARRQTVGEEDDCPICFDSLGGNATTTSFCRVRCGANFHKVCIQHWFQQNRRKPTCPMCREPWSDGTTSTPQKNKSVNREGFTNLGRLQGQSTDRDTSTYSSPSDYHKRRRFW
jgi:hypothetical protein